jgi:hypothetical protein
MPKAPRRGSADDVSATGLAAGAQLGFVYLAPSLTTTATSRPNQFSRPNNRVNCLSARDSRPFPSSEHTQGLKTAFLHIITCLTGHTCPNHGRVNGIVPGAPGNIPRVSCKVTADKQSIKEGAPKVEGCMAAIISKCRRLSLCRICVEAHFSKPRQCPVLAVQLPTGWLGTSGCPGFRTFDAFTYLRLRNRQHYTTPPWRPGQDGRRPNRSQHDVRKA